MVSYPATQHLNLHITAAVLFHIGFLDFYMNIDCEGSQNVSHDLVYYHI